MHEFRYVNGRLHCEDVAVAALVKKHGTPLYVYSQGTFTGNYERLTEALEGLREFEEAGLLEISDKRVDVNPTGTLLIRNIAMPFDAYMAKYAGNRKSFSKTV